MSSINRRRKNMVSIYRSVSFWMDVEHHHIHSSFEKNIIIVERTIQYIKDRTEGFDDYFPCGKNKCRLEHVTHWLNLFVVYIIAWLHLLSEQSRCCRKICIHKEWFVNLIVFICNNRTFCLVTYIDDSYKLKGTHE